MLYSSKQVALMTGKDHSTVRHHARKRGIGRKMGRDWFFTKKDIEEIEQIKPGNQRTNYHMQHSGPSKPTVGSHARKREYPVRVLAVVPHDSERHT